jgi:hypothetical protein
VSTTDELPDRIMTVWEDNGTCWNVDADDEKLLRAARREWLERHIDSLLDLTTLGGSAVTVCASTVVSWHVHTAEQRRRNLELSRSLEQERGEGWQGEG